MISPLPARSFRTFALVLALATTLVAPVSAHAVRTLGLSSGTFKFEVPPSGELDGEVVVSNEGDEPLKVMVYSSDQKVDGKGNISFVAPTRADLTSLNSPSTWVRISMPANSKSIGNIPYLEIGPGKRVPVKFSLSVPSGIAPGDHNVMVFFESFDLPEQGQTVRSSVSGRLGTRITLRVPGDLFKRIEVRPFNVPAFVIGGAVPYSFTVRNGGNVDERVGARILLLDRGGNEVTSQTPINGRISFAGTDTEASGTVLAQGTAIGSYKVRLDVTEVDEDGKAIAGGKDTVTEERSVWMVPLWLVIAAAAIVLLTAARIVWSAAANATRRKQEIRHRRARRTAHEE